jgi:hypothetical protein
MALSSGAGERPRSPGFTRSCAKRSIEACGRGTLHRVAMLP